MLVKEADTDGDGEISFEEFKTLMKKLVMDEQNTVEKKKSVMKKRHQLK